MKPLIFEFFSLSASGPRLTFKMTHKKLGQLDICARSYGKNTKIV